MTTETFRRQGAGYALTVQTVSGGYLTLWRHRDSFDSNGKVWKRRGTILTDRWPVEDPLGLMDMAVRNGCLPWPVESEPDFRAVPMGKVQGHDVRGVLLKCWQALQAQAARAVVAIPPAAPPVAAAPFVEAAGSR